jgi:hypothetical protein
LRRPAIRLAESKSPRARPASSRTRGDSSLFPRHRVDFTLRQLHYSKKCISYKIAEHVAGIRALRHTFATAVALVVLQASGRGGAWRYPCSRDRWCGFRTTRTSLLVMR